MKKNIYIIILNVFLCSFELSSSQRNANIDNTSSQKTIVPFSSLNKSKKALIPCSGSYNPEASLQRPPAMFERKKPNARQRILVIKDCIKKNDAQ